MRNPHWFTEEFNIVIQTYQPDFSDLYQLVHMLFSEGRAQHWIKTTNWENPQRSPGLQLGDQPTNLLWDQAEAIAQWLHSANPRAFLRQKNFVLLGQNLVLCTKYQLNLFMTTMKNESEVAQSCLTLCNPMGCSLPGSSVHGIFQARILEWVAISFSRRSSWPRD